MPPNTSAEDVLEMKPDGIFLSNGPGDPSTLTAVVSEIKKMIDTNIPIFGICLGHELMSLAYDLKIE